MRTRLIACLIAPAMTATAVPAAPQSTTAPQAAPSLPPGETPPEAASDPRSTDTAEAPGGPGARQPAPESDPPQRGER